MSANPTLSELKNRRLIWQARQHDLVTHHCLRSGYPLLDQQLDGGWPISGVVELRPAQLGIGELRLILPTLEHLNQPTKLQAWVNAPARISPQCLSPGVLTQTIIATPQRVQDGYWVTEQLLNSGCCSSLVFWLDELSPTQAKRLQLAAKNSQTLVFIIRPASQDEQSLALSLRIKLQACAEGLQVDIFKRQQGWPIAPFTLDLQARWPQLFTQAKNSSTKGGSAKVFTHPICRPRRHSIIPAAPSSFPRRRESIV